MKNKYFLLRHGEALSNVKEILSCWPEKKKFPLTEKGRKDIKAVAEDLKEKNIDFIFSSDLLRTKQTTEIIAAAFGVKPKYDKRLREYDIGVFNGRPEAGMTEFFSKRNRFKDVSPKGENYTQVAERMFDFFKELEKKYSGKTILIISHQVPLTMLEAKVKGVSFKGLRSSKDLASSLSGKKRLDPGEIRLLKRV